MHDIVRYPPNYETLSEDTIGNVKQRVEPVLHTFAFGNTSSDMFDHQSNPEIQVEGHAGKRGLHAVRSTQKRKYRTSAESRRLERLRKNQERYRLRQRKLLNDLENGNEKLREEIAIMQAQLDNHPTEFNIPLTLWSVVTDYFRFFQHGLRTRTKITSTQIDFLRLAMAPEIDAGTVSGITAFTNSWAAFTHLFQDVEMKLKSLNLIGHNVLVATTTTSITLSNHALINMCPHLFSFSSDKNKEAIRVNIVGKLLNQRLVLHGSVYFGWGNSIHRVERLYTQVDLLSPLLQLLGNVRDLSFMTSNAFFIPLLLN